jgi:hypothetical protein
VEEDNARPRGDIDACELVGRPLDRSQTRETDESTTSSNCADTEVGGFLVHREFTGRQRPTPHAQRYRAQGVVSDGGIGSVIFGMPSESGTSVNDEFVEVSLSREDRTDLEATERLPAAATESVGAPH